MRLQDPESETSQALLRLLKSLVKKLTVKHFSGGGKEDQFAKILALHRWFGNVFIYGTINPALVLQPLLFRLVTPVISNLPLQPAEYCLPVLTMSEKKQILVSNPVDATVLFRLIDELAKKFVFGVTSHQKVPAVFSRALFAELQALVTAHEFSKSFSHHTHLMGLLKLRARELAAIASCPTQNLAFGKFLDKIILTYFPADMDGKQVPATETPFWHEFPTHELALSTFINLLESHVQHNQSCYPVKKNKLRVALSQVCRYLAPTFEFDRPSGMYQLIVIDDTTPGSDGVAARATYICNYIQEAVTNSNPPFLQSRHDSRILVPIHCVPADNATLPTNALPPIIPATTKIT